MSSPSGRSDPDSLTQILWLLPIFFGSAALGGLSGTLAIAMAVAPRQFLTVEGFLRIDPIGVVLGIFFGAFLGGPLTLTAMGYSMRTLPRTWWGWAVSGFVGGAIVVLGVTGVIFGFSRL